MSMTGSTATQRIEELGRQVGQRQFDRGLIQSRSNGASSWAAESLRRHPLLIGLAAVALGGLIAACLLRR
jgi:hypothetical protein